MHFLIKFSFTILLISYSSIIIAQDIEIKPGTVEHNEGLRPCIVVHLDPEPKTLKKKWKTYLKENYDFKLKGIGFLTNKDLLKSEDIVVDDISPKRLDFYTKIIEDEVGSEMKVFASFGYDIYVDKQETPEAYETMKKMLNDFLKSYLPKYYKSEVKESKKKVKKLTKQVKNLKKDISKNKEEIEDLKKEIDELTEEVSEKETKLEEATIKLKQRKLKLERISSY